MRRNSLFQNLDWVSIFLYLSICAIGVAFIYSTTYSVENYSLFSFSTAAGKQITWGFVSLVAAFFILIVDSKFYTSFAYIIYGAILILLLSVLFFGVTINGSKSWFSLGPIRFQPAEFAKFAVCLALAKYMTGLNINLEKWKNKLGAFALIFIPISLILIQGDVGSALVFSSFIFVLHREGLQNEYLIFGFGLLFISIMSLLYSPFALLAIYCAVLILFVFFNKKLKQPIFGIFAWIIGLSIVAWLYINYLAPMIPLSESLLYLPLAIAFFVVLLIGVFFHYKKKSWILPVLGFLFLVATYTISVDYIFNNVLKQHHRNRINLILGKIEDQQGVGYNLFQSKIAIGSGGFTGKGYLNGTQTKFNFVPEQSTDFIFTSLAEELGFLGCFFFIALFTGFLLRLLQLAERQRSKFSRVYGYGVVAILFFHFAISIAMTIGLAPVIGIPLPMVSYGGSSLLAFTILIFIFLKLDTQRLNVFR